MVRDQHPGLAAGWIFPSQAGGLHKGSPLTKVLAAACKACGTKHQVSPHGLRHTANDLMRRVASGDVVRSIMGHSTPAMTHHYSHVDEGEKRTAASRVLGVIRGGKGEEKGEGQPSAPAAAPG
jgi:integrase